MTKHTLDERTQAVLSVIRDKKPVKTIAREYDVNKATIQAWVRKYEADGVNGLKENKGWKKYSQELKMEAVKYYLNGKAGLKPTCKKFNISDPSVLRQWIKHYTSGKRNKSTGKGRSTMKTGRKTTFKERIEIVQFTIAHDFDYQQAVDNYQVSYQQVYSWVRKYKRDGEQALQDRRGKTLESKPDLTSEEKLRLQIKKLEHRNQYLETENGLLKKLEEIERGEKLRD